MSGLFLTNLKAMDRYVSRSRQRAGAMLGTLEVVRGTLGRYGGTLGAVQGYTL